MFRRTLVVLAVLALSACGSPGPDTSDSKLTVVAGFYPLQYLAERIGGDRVSVASLTKPGAEPHDLELTPQAVVALAQADLVVYLNGFQPEVDKAVDDQAFDVTASADLSDGPQGAVDLHFWLDPVRLQSVAAALADRLSEADPAGAATFKANATKVSADLATLDEDFRTGLAGCSIRTLVTSHTSFGYLAERYGLRQVGIAGLTPETEPDAGRLAEVSRLVRAQGVRTIYYETLVSPAVAETIAREAGVGTAVLDPLEGLTDRSLGQDYLAVMRANLASLKKGQACP